VICVNDSGTAMHFEVKSKATEFTFAGRDWHDLQRCVARATGGGVCGCAS
jgi:hypothetical protein